MTRCHSQNYFRQELYHCSLKLAVAALASVRAGCVELIAGQFRGQKIYWRWIHLRNRRGHPGGSSWLIKNRADFSLAENIQLLHGVFAKTELFSGVSWRCFSHPRQPSEKETEVKLGPL